MKDFLPITNSPKECEHNAEIMASQILSPAVDAETQLKLCAAHNIP